MLFLRWMPRRFFIICHETLLLRNGIIGSLGSDFWWIRVSPELVPAMAREFDWNRLGRCMMIDVREGIITWISPSSLHEIFGFSSDEIVKEAGLVLQKRVGDAGNPLEGS